MFIDKLYMIMRNGTGTKLNTLLNCINYVVQSCHYMLVMAASRHLLYGETSHMHWSEVISAHPEIFAGPFYEL